MIALDTSAIVALARKEPEGHLFEEMLVRGAVIGLPTLLETRMVLQSLMPAFADTFVARIALRPSIQAAPFTYEMYGAAVEAFARYGKGQGHPAQLNFGDCMAYAVAKVRDLPLLYKGGDFARTDIVAAWRPPS